MKNNTIATEGPELTEENFFCLKVRKKYWMSFTRKRESRLAAGAGINLTENTLLLSVLSVAKSYFVLRARGWAAS